MIQIMICVLYTNSFLIETLVYQTEVPKNIALLQARFDQKFTEKEILFFGNLKSTNRHKLKTMAHCLIQKNDIKKELSNTELNLLTLATRVYYLKSNSYLISLPFCFYIDILIYNFKKILDFVLENVLPNKKNYNINREILQERYIQKNRFRLIELQKIVRTYNPIVFIIFLLINAHCEKVNILKKRLIWNNISHKSKMINVFMHKLVKSMYLKEKVNIIDVKTPLHKDSNNVNDIINLYNKNVPNRKITKKMRLKILFICAYCRNNLNYQNKKMVPAFVDVLICFFKYSKYSKRITLIKILQLSYISKIIYMLYNEFLDFCINKNERLFATMNMIALDFYEHHIQNHLFVEPFAGYKLLRLSLILGKFRKEDAYSLFCNPIIYNLYFPIFLMLFLQNSVVENVRRCDRSLFTFNYEIKILIKKYETLITFCLYEKDLGIRTIKWVNIEQFILENKNYTFIQLWHDKIYNNMKVRHLISKYAKVIFTYHQYSFRSVSRTQPCHIM